MGSFNTGLPIYLLGPLSAFVFSFLLAVISAPTTLALLPLLLFGIAVAEDILEFFGFDTLVWDNNKVTPSGWFFIVLLASSKLRALAGNLTDPLPICL